VKVTGIILFLTTLNFLGRCDDSLTNTTPQNTQITTNKTRLEKINSPITFKQHVFQEKTLTFKGYDQKLVSQIETQWNSLLQKEPIISDDAGEVIVKFRLHDDGRVSDIELAGKTNSIFAPVCVEAVKNCSPFAKWSNDMRFMVGTNYREINFTFYFNQKAPKQ
jgi:outer membrane biosynthesis protein TonB